MQFAKNVLGTTNIEVTELCFGTLILGALQADLSPADGAKAIRRALDEGVNFIDTAKGYKTYQHVREGTKGYNDIVIASKSPVKDPAEMRKDVETCLRELNRETIDIFHLHLVKSRDDMREREDALDVLVKCREQGLIRAVGLSTHGPEGVYAALDYPEIEVIFPLLNKTGIGINNGTVESMERAVIKARDKGVGLYVMKPLGGGHLLDDIPGAIDYVRETTLFDSIAVGLKTPEEVDIMIGVFSGEPEARDRALEAGKTKAGTKQLIIYEFQCEKCGACVEACAQNAISLGENSAVVDHSKCVLCGYCAAECPKFAIRVI